MAMHVYKIVAETVAYVEARTLSEAKETFDDGMSDIEDTVITEAKEISQEEYEEILSKL